MKRIIIVASAIAFVIACLIAIAISPSDIVVKRSDVAVVKMAVFNATAISNFGSDIVSADFNGDNVIDLALSQYRIDLGNDGIDRTGQVYVFYGHTSGFANLSLANADVILNGTTNSSFGHNLYAADVNNDSRKDLIVGAQSKNLTGNDRPWYGQVYIFYSNSDGLHSYTPAYANITFNGSSYYGGFGGTYFPSNGGFLIDDFNNDNLTDIAIGADAIGSVGYIGHIYIFYGSEDGFHSYSAAQANVTFNGTTPDYFGYAWSKGDFNNDTFPDIAIGEPYKNLSGGAGDANQGQVYVFYGGSNGFISQTADQANATFNCSTQQYTYCGWSLAAADFNNNGITDLAISAVGTNLSGGASDSRGQVYILYGSNSVWAGGNITQIANVTLNGSAPSQFGFSLLADDLNNDNRTDLVVGANLRNNSGGTDLSSRDGQTSVFFGTSNGILPSTADNANLSINGSVNDYFGSYLSAGDYDNDGVKEIAVSAPAANLSGQYGTTWEGQIYVLKLNYQPTSSTIPNQSWNEDNSITINLSAHFSDVNGDELNYTWSTVSDISASIDEITNIVTLSPTANWNGQRNIVFYANDSYNDLVASNNITLTVSNTADCGDNTCDSSESCTSCASDCGACPAVSGSSTAAAEPKAAHTFTTVTPESPATADFKNMAVSSITLTTDETAANVRLEVKEVSKTDVPMPETVVYKLIDIKASNIELKEAKIKFKVKLSWLEENDVGQGEVVLMHHKDSWKKLKTAYTGKDDENAYYEAKTGSLSMFAISYQKKEEIKEEPQQEEPVREQKIDAEPISIQPTKKCPYGKIALISLAILAGISYIVFLNKRKH